MKEQITKFDLADAFKALDDIAAPSVKGIRANRMDLSEATKRVDRLSMLVEDYYDVQDQGDLEQANNDMQADVAKAKLAKIEKIVDLDAETPEDIQPSYVGKTIIQCPQCMTLFYKDAADIEKSAEDTETVNVGEICQHCGNDSGYTLIGKVAEETPDEIPAEEPTTEEAPAEEPAEEEPTEEAPTEEAPAEEETAEVELPELDFGAEEEPAKQESLHNSKFLKKAAKDAMNTKFHSENLTLNEDLNNETVTEAKCYDTGGGCLWYFGTLSDGNKFFINTVSDECYTFDPVFNIKANIDKLFNADSSNKADKIWNNIFEPALIEIIDYTEDKFDIIKTEAEKLCSTGMGEALREDLDNDMDQFNAYIDYLQKLLDQDEKALEAAKKVKDNDLTISMLEKRVESDKAELEAALPQAVKDKQNEEELPTMEDIEETEEVAETPVEEPAKQESLHKSKFLKAAEKDAMNTKFHSDNLSLNEAKTAKEVKYNTYTEIMWALTGGKKIKDELGRTRLSGGPYAVPDTGINYKTNSLKVYGENEAALQPAIDIANQFGKTTSEIKFDKYISGPRKYWLEIQLDPEDWEDGEFEESVNRSKMDDYDMIRAGISEHRTINEAEGDTSATVDTNLDKLIDTPEYKEPVNDAEIRAILAKSVDESAKKCKNCELDNVTDIHDEAMNECISGYLNEVYSNVENFTTTNCSICGNKVVLEGVINFKSGKSKPTTFELKATKNSMLEGYNKDLGGKDSNFKVKYALESGKMIYPRAMSYNYKINNQLVEGLIKK